MSHGLTKTTLALPPFTADAKVRYWPMRNFLSLSRINRQIFKIMLIKFPWGCGHCRLVVKCIYFSLTNNVLRYVLFHVSCGHLEV